MINFPAVYACLLQAGRGLPTQTKWALAQIITAKKFFHLWAEARHTPQIYPGINDGEILIAWQEP